MKRVLMLLAAATTLAACGTGTDAAQSAGASSAPASAPAPATEQAPVKDYNAQDVMFARMMIPHHRQALDMAEMVPSRSASPEVKKLARRIEAAQDPEIRTMTGWLRQWGEEAPADGGGAHEGHGSGMMTEADMRKLAGLKGERFDKEWLTMMIAHHKGAVEMAEQEKRAGRYAPAKEMADAIIRTQNVEIDEMRELGGE
ncbi:DUF305 domain-containing protein [Bailinhaonella thermotolerans]|uniref:DUF305 domain-containing protein n=1 Tax=Bailinhaonella thermotolerans TaxID=1070861 RepID=A0A3A4AT12_9ACTN|nr:DUF305 domain-containing protein [Bailinhaonella thermotolerans]RJL32483.1 DUF305 domain-containing protein [Bailinhaonella thermotolerans]